MVSNKNIISWADSKGIARDYEVAVPYVVNGYLFSVAQVSSSVFIRVALDGVLPKEEVKELRKQLKQFKVANIVSVEKNNNQPFTGLLATLGNAKPENIDGIINLIVSFLAQQNIGPDYKCKFCGNSGCDSYAEDLKSTSVLPAHAECNRIEGEKLATEANKHRNTGGVIRGIIGALIGSIVAIIVLLVITNFINTIFSIELILIPLFAALFAKWFRGSMSGVTIAFVLIFSLIGTAGFLLLFDYGTGEDVKFLIYSVFTYIMGIAGGIGIITSAGSGKQNQAKTLIRDAEIAMRNRAAQPVQQAAASVEQQAVPAFTPPIAPPVASAPTEPLEAAQSQSYQAFEEMDSL